MGAKVISVYLMISCFFPIVWMGDPNLVVTAKQFDNFKGVDPTTHCGNMKGMQDECNKLGKAHKFTDGTKPFTKGYPNCVNADIVVQKDDNCSKTTIKHAMVINCSWRSDLYFIIGKGQLPNHFMQYYTYEDGSCGAHKDIPYPCN